MIDIEEIENMKQWTDKYKVRMFWDLVREVKRLSERLKEANDDEWHRREWVENYLMSKGMSCADVAQGLENFENYRSE
jgi:hypothetical protein